MANINSWIGCKISITSKKQIRYEGVICDIDGEKGLIGLENVKCFGTENRFLPHESGFIPSSDQIHEFVIFNSFDINDLVLIKDEQPPSIFVDLAALSIESPGLEQKSSGEKIAQISLTQEEDKQKQQNEIQQTNQIKEEEELSIDQQPQQIQNQETGKSQSRPQKQQSEGKEQKKKQFQQYGLNQPHDQIRYLNSTIQQPNQYQTQNDNLSSFFRTENDSNQFQPDFDFTAAMKNFDKINLSVMMNDNQDDYTHRDSNMQINQKDEQNSFFDNFSSEKDQKNNKTSRRSERAVNYETFGVASPYLSSRQRGNDYRRYNRGRGSYGDTRPYAEQNQNNFEQRRNYNNHYKNRGNKNSNNRNQQTKGNYYEQPQEN